MLYDRSKTARRLELEALDPRLACCDIQTLTSVITPTCSQSCHQDLGYFILEIA